MFIFSFYKDITIHEYSYISSLTKGYEREQRELQSDERFIRQDIEVEET